MFMQFMYLIWSYKTESGTASYLLEEMTSFLWKVCMILLLFYSMLTRGSFFNPFSRLHIIKSVALYLDHIWIAVMLFLLFFHLFSFSPSPFFFFCGFSAVGDIIVMAAFQRPHLLCHLWIYVTLHGISSNDLILSFLCTSTHFLTLDTIKPSFI